MRRGDIVTVAGGVHASNPRPALIVQDDRFGATDSLTVCPFTSLEVEAPLLRVPVAADERHGLGHDTFLMIDKITKSGEATCTRWLDGLRQRSWSSSRGDSSPS
ncbi:MAG TPA: type II toxin-antitoxin system PemK/MazF family toxin [Marmoricola sp.]|nr:type II toxin-antitoxin system PemK/MazF family toxin [Marmoricola sp.]